MHRERRLEPENEEQFWIYVIATAQSPDVGAHQYRSVQTDEAIYQVLSASSSEGRAAMQLSLEGQEFIRCVFHKEREAV